MKSRYIFKVTGKRYERFLKTLRQLHVLVYEVSYVDGTMRIEVDEEGFSRLNKLKTTYQLEMISCKGKARWHFLFQKYRLFLMTLFLGGCLLLFLSNLIWKIEVIHSKQEIRDLLISALEEEKVYPFRFKLSFQEKERIKKEILETYKEKLEWIEIEEVGTKYVVRVEERKQKTEEKETTPRNIIAKKDAMILTIQAETGEILKKRFDYVKKGEILVSGIIHKNEEAKTKVRATGSVFGEVWYTVSVLLPVDYQEEKILGNPKKRLGLHLLTHTLLFQKKPYRIRNSKPLLKNAWIPLSLSIDTIQEVEQIKKHYTLESGEQEGIQLALSKLKVKIPPNSEILAQKVLKKQIKGSKIYVEVFFKVKEEITAYQSLENIDLSLEENQKEVEE